MRLVRRLRTLGGDEGDTLIEILVTIVVLGITVTAVIGALTLTITGSESHRRLTNVEVVTRAYGEKVVDQAMQVPTTTLTALAKAGDNSISVNPSVTFPSTPFTAAVDGEVVDVTSVSGSTWTVSTLTEDHPNGATVQRYVFYNAHTGTCPTPASFNVTGYTAPADSKITTPSVTGIEFFDNQGHPIPSQFSTPPSTLCNSYWSNSSPPAPLTATICSGFDTPEHLTECDPGLIRLTITASSTDTGATSATTTTRVLIRRGNG